MRKKSAIFLSLAFLLVLSLSITGLAKDLLVPEDYSSIQSAVDAAQSGDRILLSSGNYEEDVVISGKNNLTIRSRDLREFTTINGQITVEDSTNTTLSGFNVTGPGYGVAVRGECVGLTFDDIAVLQNAGDGFNFGGEGTEYYHVNITNSKISSNGGDGITLKGKGNDITIRGNEITANGTYTPAGAAGDVEPKGAKAVGLRVGLSEEEAGGAGGVGEAAGVLRILIADNVINENAFAAIHSVLERLETS